MYRIHQSHVGRIVVGLAACVGALLAAPPAVHAVARAWVGGAGSSWETAGNWSPSGSPTNTDSISITGGAGPYTVNIDDTTANTGDSNTWLTVNSLTIGPSGGGTLLINYTNPTKVFRSDGQISLGYGSVAGGTGIMILSNGVVSGTRIDIGLNDGSASALKVSGGTLSLSNPGGTTLLLGEQYGDGTALIDGGSVSATGTYCFVGYLTPGTLTVSNGTVFIQSSQGVTLANGAGAAGSGLRVSGGSVTITNTGVVPALTIGNGGTASASVSGGSLTVLGTVNVGNGSAGTLTVSGGQLNIFGSTAVGLNVSGVSGAAGTMIVSNGTVNLDGAASSVGGSGAGPAILKIHGGTVNTLNGSRLDLGSQGNANVLIDGGKLLTTNALPNGYSGDYWVGYYGSTTTMTISNGEFRAVRLGIGGGNSAYGEVNVYGGLFSMDIPNPGTFNGGLFLGQYWGGAALGSATGKVVVADSGVLQFANGQNVSLGVSGQPNNVGTITIRDGGTVRLLGGLNIYTNNGTFTVTNGVVEFLNVGSAALPAGITYAGSNTLSLNHSTNASVGATTFGSGQNFSTLALANGGKYQSSGLTTIGSGGSLVVTDGASTITGDLTLQADGKLVVEIGGTNDYSSLNAGGNVVLGGATLEVTLHAPPVASFQYRIINKTSSGTIPDQFANSRATASYGGKTYDLAVRYDVGDGGNDVELFRSMGTVFIVH